MPWPRSRALSGAVLGAVLALGAPCGLLLVRFLERGEIGLRAALAEVRADPATFFYVTLSTLLAFSLFGHARGRHADRLYEVSSSDPLTRLKNRRAFEERLREEVTRAARYRMPVSVLLVDLDGLKLLNDRKGHRAGDDALVRVAGAIRGGSRQTDVAARWGGDEFALLAPSTGREEALQLGERVRELAAQSEEGITVSIGVATFEIDDRVGDPETLLREADAALYEAKREGRNRVQAAARSR
jgi:diguanylate cyclase (GGDEF)-like protein